MEEDRMTLELLDLYPSELEIEVGEGEDFSRITCSGSTVTFETRWLGSHHVKRHETRPADADWEEFWSSLDALNVWSWEGYYFDPNARPTSWSVRIARAGKVVRATGCGAFPPGGKGEESRVWSKFCQALGLLIDDQEFP